MADSLTAARPYAKALFEVAAKEDAKSWLPLMEMCTTLGLNDDSKRFLNAHDLSLDSFDNVITTLSKQAGIETIPAHFKDFTKVLSHNKRFGLLPEIATLFIEEVNKSNDTVIAEIFSAKALTEDSKNKLIDKLAKKYGKKVEASIEIDESLIGGALIRIGDTVIDGTVKGRLEQLTKALN